MATITQLPTTPVAGQQKHNYDRSDGAYKPFVKKHMRRWLKQQTLVESEPPEAIRAYQYALSLFHLLPVQIEQALASGLNHNAFLEAEVPYIQAILNIMGVKDVERLRTYAWSEEEQAIAAEGPTAKELERERKAQAAAAALKEKELAQARAIMAKYGIPVTQQ